MHGNDPLDGVVFDLDGVITFTARQHLAAWKELFDSYLRRRAEATGASAELFTEADYRAHVDGKPRLDGVRAFLASRSIVIPDGGPDDPPGRETVHGLGGLKNRIFQDRIAREGVDVDREAVRLLRELRTEEVLVGMASSSRNTQRILSAAGLDGFFDAEVGGVESAELGLHGKPAPDIFLECIGRMGLAGPERSVLIEDAAAGVEGGRAGGFGLVIGVDREGGRGLLERGADRVIQGFEGVHPRALRTWLATNGRETRRRASQATER